MGGDLRLTGLKQIKEKVEKLSGCTISELQFLEAMDDPQLIESIAKRVQVLDLRGPVGRGFALNVYGWTVSLGKDGYYRLYKTLEGKTESIYLGKRLDSEKARRKIAKKERKLGLL
jgi:hypothetical protein